MTENKVTFGLENVHVAPIQSISEAGVITYGQVFRFPGAMELTLDPKGDSGSVKADNIDYYFVNSNEGYEGKLKVPNIIEDPTTGVITEKADAKTTNFAIMFEFSGDANKTRHVMYYCSASRPSSGSATKNGTNVNERELSFNASPRPGDQVVKRSITSADDQEVYKKWFEKVYEPNQAL